MIEVTLANYEVQMAAAVGSRRQLNAVMKAREPRFGEQHDGQLHRNHLRGAMAELAVAKYLDVYWGGHVGVFTSLDDVGKYEIRYSMRSDLKVKENDEGIVISVTGQPPKMKIAGYINAEDAMRDEWKKDFNNGGKPAFFVPHRCLKSVEALKDG